MSVFIFNDTTYMSRRIGAYRIASALRRRGIATEVIDFLSQWDIDQLIACLNEYDDIPWVGISTPFLRSTQPNHFDSRLKITELSSENEIKLIQYLNSRNIPIVIGGAASETLINYFSGYYFITGFADEAILHFHNHITLGHPLTFEVINGNKVLRANKVYGDIDLKYIDTFYEKSDFINKNEILPIEISRGCIFRCAFCGFSHLGKKLGTYVRPKECIQREIEDVHNKWGTKWFLFADDTFNDHIDKMKMIQKVREDSKIPFQFWAYGRLDLLQRYPEMVDLMEKTGWSAVTFGVETLNRKAGARIGKGADPEKLKNFLLNLRNLLPELHIQINLIIGLPKDTEDSIRSTVDWILVNDIANYLRVVSLDIRNPNSTESPSLMSQNPQKYGYEINGTDGIRYKWSNANFNNFSADKLAREINSYIKQNKTHNLPFHKLHFRKMYEKNELKTSIEVSKIYDLQASNYIKNKSKYLLNRGSKKIERENETYTNIYK